ncbi:MAG: Hydroxysqualene dehydroxylase [Xylophilus sp.]|nr:MAG: Hydroxysqualene dehydroxylase [Xylophilus sp.]
MADAARGLTRRVMDELVEPLCVSALNLPAAQASGAVFLRVLRDALFGTRGGADLLLPRTDLGALLPEAATRWLAGRGAAVRLGHRVQQLAAEGTGWRVDGTRFDRVVLALPPAEAVRLLRPLAALHPPVAEWIALAQALEFTAIATAYAFAPQGAALPAPMLALRGGADDGPAQFVFDRGRLGGPAGLLAFVVSHAGGEAEAIEAAVLAQAARQLPWLGVLTPLRTVVERRATFACTPALRRPPQALAAGLAAAGDHVEGPYPATLEGAVRSGLQSIPGTHRGGAGHIAERTDARSESLSHIPPTLPPRSAHRSSARDAYPLISADGRVPADRPPRHAADRDAARGARRG